jgi:hypothetical protein
MNITRNKKTKFHARNLPFNGGCLQRSFITNSVAEF